MSGIEVRWLAGCGLLLGAGLVLLDFARSLSTRGEIPIAMR